MGLKDQFVRMRGEWLPRVDLEMEYEGRLITWMSIDFAKGTYKTHVGVPTTGPYRVKMVRSPPFGPNFEVYEGKVERTERVYPGVLNCVDVWEYTFTVTTPVGNAVVVYERTFLDQLCVVESVTINGKEVWPNHD